MQRFASKYMYLIKKKKTTKYGSTQAFSIHYVVLMTKRYLNLHIL